MKLAFYLNEGSILPKEEGKLLLALQVIGISKKTAKLLNI
jgi:hypothetical protein